MFICSHTPLPPLNEFVENFWAYRGFDSPELKEHILPTGTFELVFNLQCDKLRIDESGKPRQSRRLSGAVVSGPYESFFRTDTSQEADVVGVHFKPGGAFPFLGVPPHELGGTHMDLSSIWGGQAIEIREQLCAARSQVEQFRILEGSLLSRVRRPLERHPAVALALEVLPGDYRRTVVRRLAREAGYSDRRFIDLFRAEVGLKPKLFSRIQRFQRLLRQVHRSAGPDWTQLALKYGYFDQSHLIRDFFAFSGTTPADYLRRLQDLRRRNLQVKFNHLPLIP